MILIYIFGGEPGGWQLITYKSILGYIISALLLILLLWIWFGTGYEIEKAVLKVRSGPFKSKIEIKEIKKIRKTKNPFTAPALSVDRLEILYSNYEVINISPKNEAAFVHHLLAVNPNIQVDDISLD